MFRLKDRWTELPLPNRDYIWRKCFPGDTGFHQRFDPQALKDREARAHLDPSFVEKAAERLKLSGK